jgi:beta-lactam-binding protein with PASTA domain
MRRLLLPAAVLVALTMAAITYAAGQRLAVTPSATGTRAQTTVLTVVVPDVRHESYVFAKSELQDAGFAWKVTGKVQGYPANTVVSQSPAPGTKLIDTGAPLVTLTLEQNKQYAPQGGPQDSSPYEPTAHELAGSG